MNTSDIALGSVVVGVDGSDHSDHAVDWAARHAAKHARALVLVNVVNASAGAAAWMARGGPDPTPYLQDSDAAGNAVLAAAHERAASFGPELEIDEVLLCSDPRSALLEVTGQAQILVLGSRGRGPLSSLLLGSVSATVARHADCPVVVVRPHHPGRVRNGVLVGADGTAGSVPVLDFAFRQASELDLPLTVVHTVFVARAPAGLALDVVDDDMRCEDSALTLSETMVGLGEKFPEVKVVRHIVWRRADPGLLELANTMDLVVVGHHRQDAMRRAMFGSVGLSVLEHCATVVAVVPQL